MPLLSLRGWLVLAWSMVNKLVWAVWSGCSLNSIIFLSSPSELLCLELSSSKSLDTQDSDSSMLSESDSESSGTWMPSALRDAVFSALANSAMVF